MAVTIEWMPQRQIIYGIVISALSLIVTVALAVGRRRRAPPASRVGSATVPHPDTSTGRANGAVHASRAPAWIDLALLAPVLFVVGGVPAAIAYLVIRLQWRQRMGQTPNWLPAAVAVGAWTISSLYIAAMQFGYRHQPDPQWPSRFSLVSPLTWVAIGALLGAVTWFDANSTTDHCGDSPSD
jgi:hypothetical protein